MSQTAVFFRALHGSLQVLQRNFELQMVEILSSICVYKQLETMTS